MRYLITEPFDAKTAKKHKGTDFSVEEFLLLYLKTFKNPPFQTGWETTHILLKTWRPLDHLPMNSQSTGLGDFSRPIAKQSITVDPDVFPDGKKNRGSQSETLSYAKMLTKH